MPQTSALRARAPQRGRDCSAAGAVSICSIETRHRTSSSWSYGYQLFSASVQLISLIILNPIQTHLPALQSIMQHHRRGHLLPQRLRLFLRRFCTLLATATSFLYGTSLVIYPSVKDMSARNSRMLSGPQTFDGKLAKEDRPQGSLRKVLKFPGNRRFGIALEKQQWKL